MPEEKTNYKLLSDEPAYEFQRKDELRFFDAAEVLAGAALQATSPITLGVFGNWGTGKTSLMRLMMKVVKERGQVADPATAQKRSLTTADLSIEEAAIPVWFNAWQYEREEHLIIPLIATIARELELRRKEWEKIRLDDTVEDAAKKGLEKLKRGGKGLYDRLRAALYGISVKGELPVPLPGGLEIGASVKDMVDRYEAITQDTLMARSLYFEAFDKLRELAGKSQDEVKRPQIVVFIDDLDRCFPEKAVHLLESIKLILHLPGFAFVMGIYPEIIEEFIRNKYLAQYPLAAMKVMGEGKEGNESYLYRRMNEYLMYFDKYLEKIVQVAHYVPQREPNEMHQYILQLLKDAHIDQEFLPEGISEAERNELLEVIAEVGERNPRSIVRRINGFIVKWRIINRENEEPCAILALVVNEKAGDRKYSTFRDDLNVSINNGDEAEKEIGVIIADQLEKESIRRADTHRDRIQILLEAERELACDEVRKRRASAAISVLDGDSALLNVLRTKAGIQWLRDRELRQNLLEKAGVPVEGQLGRQEEEPPEEQREGRLQTSEGAIRELLANMVSIPAGSFMMGSEVAEDEKPIHEVTLEAFEISATPITQAHYEAVMGYNHAHFKGPDNPVEQVSWEDATEFCKRLSKRTGDHFTLPSEVQWEYACRAGSDAAFCFGDDETQLDAYAWYNMNSEGRTHPVGQKKPNVWGLYDMHGNVWEWCQDAYDAYISDEADRVKLNELEGAQMRVNRGGGWCAAPNGCRSAKRYSGAPSDRYNGLGFRVLAVRQAGK